MDRNENAHSMHHPRKGIMTTSMVGLKNGHIRRNLPKNGETQRYSCERRRRRKPFIVCYKTDILSAVLVVWCQSTVLQATSRTCFRIVSCLSQKERDQDESSSESWMLTEDKCKLPETASDNIARASTTAGNCMVHQRSHYRDKSQQLCF